MNVEVVGQAFDHRSIVVHTGRRLVAIADAETAAEIDPLEPYVFRAQAAGEFGDAGKSEFERRERGDLRADMDGDSHRAETWKLRGAAERTHDMGEVDAELVLALAGGDLRMGSRIDIGIDADGDIGGDAETMRHGAQRAELGSGLDIDLIHAGAEREGHLGFRLADA